jgi:hypothetical protein
MEKTLEPHQKIGRYCLITASHLAMAHYLVLNKYLKPRDLPVALALLYVYSKQTTLKACPPPKISVIKNLTQWSYASPIEESMARIEATGFIIWSNGRIVVQTPKIEIDNEAWVLWYKAFKGNHKPPYVVITNAMMRLMMRTQKKSIRVALTLLALRCLGTKKRHGIWETEGSFKISEMAKVFQMGETSLRDSLSALATLGVATITPAGPHRSQIAVNRHGNKYTVKPFWKMPKSYPQKRKLSTKPSNPKSSKLEGSKPKLEAHSRTNTLLLFSRKHEDHYILDGVFESLPDVNFYKVRPSNLTDMLELYALFLSYVERENSWEDTERYFKLFVATANKARRLGDDGGVRLFAWSLHNSIFEYYCEADFDLANERIQLFKAEVEDPERMTHQEFVTLINVPVKNDRDKKAEWARKWL